MSYLEKQRQAAEQSNGSYIVYDNNCEKNGYMVYINNMLVYRANSYYEAQQYLNRRKNG